MAALKEGAKAPAFALRDENGKVHRLSRYKGQKVVLYFYPKDNTPGCTAEAQDFNKQLVKDTEEERDRNRRQPGQRGQPQEVLRTAGAGLHPAGGPRRPHLVQIRSLWREDAVRREVQRHLPHNLHHRRDGRHREGLQGRQGGRPYEGRAEGALGSSAHTAAPLPKRSGAFFCGTELLRASRGGNIETGGEKKQGRMYGVVEKPVCGPCAPPRMTTVGSAPMARPAPMAARRSCSSRCRTGTGACPYKRWCAFVRHSGVCRNPEPMRMATLRFFIPHLLGLLKKPREARPSRGE